jgi:hypothetical protein
MSCCLPQKQNSFEVLCSERVTTLSSETQNTNKQHPDAATEWKNRGSVFLSQGKIDKNIPDPAAFRIEPKRDGACRLHFLPVEI